MNYSVEKPLAIPAHLFEKPLDRTTMNAFNLTPDAVQGSKNYAALYLVGRKNMGVWTVNALQRLVHTPSEEESFGRMHTERDLEKYQVLPVATQWVQESGMAVPSPALALYYSPAGEPSADEDIRAQDIRRRIESTHVAGIILARRSVEQS